MLVKHCLNMYMDCTGMQHWSGSAGRGNELVMSRKWISGAWQWVGTEQEVDQRGVAMSWYWAGSWTKLLHSGSVSRWDGPPGVLRWNCCTMDTRKSRSSIRARDSPTHARLPGTHTNTHTRLPDRKTNYYLWCNISNTIIFKAWQETVAHGSMRFPLNSNCPLNSQSPLNSHCPLNSQSPWNSVICCWLIAVVVWCRCF